MDSLVHFQPLADEVAGYTKPHPDRASRRIIIERAMNEWYAREPQFRGGYPKRIGGATVTPPNDPDPVVPLKKNDVVHVRRMDSDDEWCIGVVRLVSGTSGSVSVVLTLYGIVRGADGALITGILPLLIDYDRQTIAGLIDQQEYEMETKGYDATVTDGEEQEAQG